MLDFPPRPNVPLVRYCCGRCNDLYEMEWDAEDCCRPEVYQGYCCSVCEGWYEKKKDAADCCPPVDPTILDVPSAAELEAAGQIPLPLGRGQD
jgi:hypothetical protein